MMPSTNKYTEKFTEKFTWEMHLGNTLEKYIEEKIEDKNWRKKLKTKIEEKNWRKKLKKYSLQRDDKQWCSITIHAKLTSILICLTAFLASCASHVFAWLWHVCNMYTYYIHITSMYIIHTMYVIHIMYDAYQMIQFFLWLTNQRTCRFQEMDQTENKTIMIPKTWRNFRKSTDNTWLTPKTC